MNSTKITMMGKRAVVCMLALLLLTVFSWILTGCTTTALEVDFNTEGLHEGEALPELTILSAHSGTIAWEDADATLINGTNTYRYTYTDKLSGEVTVFEANLTATAHTSEGNASVIKEATCQEEGMLAHVCTICEKPYDVESIPKLAHDYSKSEHIEGTCIANGYTQYNCTLCGEPRLDDNGEVYIVLDLTPGDHVFEINEDGREKISTVITAPTCQTTGKGLVKCTLCDYRKEVVMDIAAHDFTKEVHTEGDCQTYGYTEYFCIYNCGEQKMEADGVTPYKLPDTEYGAHDYTVPVHTTGNCVEHGYNEFKCAVCDEYRYEADGETTYKESDNTYGPHDFEKNEDGSEKVSTVITAPTCQMTGKGLVKCTLCDYRKEVVIDIVEHDFTKEVHTDGDCQTYGYTEYFCIYNCGAQSQSVPDTEYGPHSYTVTQYTPGNCCSYGYTEILCSICGDFKMDDAGTETFKQYDAEYGDHTYETDAFGNYVVTEEEVVNPPTCKTEGSGYVYCIYDTTSEHSHKKLVSIPKTDHKYDKKVCRNDADEPDTYNCLHEQYYEFHCIYECGLILQDDQGDIVKEMTGIFGPHKYVNGICILCGEINLGEEVVKIWNFGPADVEGYTTDEFGYSDAVLAYLIKRQVDTEDETVYYDLVISPNGDYVGPTYNAKYLAEIPWQEQRGSSITDTYANYIKTVTVTEGITAVSDYMCQDMKVLEKCFFPNSLTTGIRVDGEQQVWMNKYLFYNCVSLTAVVNIPGNLTHVGTFSFNNCESLVEIPFDQWTELRVVERESFRYCDSLSSV